MASVRSFAWRLALNLVVVAGAVTLTGCQASCVDRGAALYASHDYVRADELLEHNEARVARASDAERSRFALYRGVTLLSLGDATRSEFWLARCRPEHLSSDERRMLQQARRTHADFSARLQQKRRSHVQHTAVASGERSSGTEPESSSVPSVGSAVQ
ncbi:MAG: hypothetical protein QM756_08235 [Polyangiaceae bacterium]